VSWAEENRDLRPFLNVLAIMVLKETNIEGRGRILRISWDEAWHILERAAVVVKREKKRRVVKRWAWTKIPGKGHNYLTLIYDLDRSTVEHIEDERKKESLDGFFCRISLGRRAKIEAIAADIWDPYLASIRSMFPDPEEKLVFDRYHLMTHMVKAVDTVRKQELRQMRGEGKIF
jgi:transposase